MQNIKIGLFVGSDTGNTDTIAADFQKEWTFCELETVNAYDMTVEDYANYEYLILALPTWYDGELQSDYENFFEQFQTIDFSGKTVALLGLGDQEGYGEFFVDGLGILAEVILANGGRIIGMVSTDSYDFEASKALYNEDTFYGLPIDEDNQMELTESRLKSWTLQLEEELSVILKAKKVIV